MSEGGRPSELTEDLTLNIRGRVLSGEKYLSIMKDLGIPAATWDTWVYKDYQGFRTKLNEWKKERLIKKAELLSDDILDTDHHGGKDGIDVHLLRIKQKEAEFVRSTLGKDQYSSKTENEITNPDGSLKTIIINKSNGSDDQPSS